MSTWPTNPSMPGPPPVGAPGPTMGPPNVPSDPTMIGGGYGPPQPPRSGANTGLIVGLVLLVVGLIAGGALLLASSDDDGDDAENASSRRERQEQEDEDCAQSGLQGVDDEGSESQDTCVPPDEVDTEITVPELPDVPDAPDGQVDVPSGDVLDALASNVYGNTPASIDEETATCIASVIIDVVGESTVAAAGADYQTVYSGSSASEDAAISSGIYTGCTTVEQDADLHADSDWPGPWGPA